LNPRVAVVLSGYGVVQRGAETMLEQLLPRLQDRFELEVYSLSGKGPGGRANRGIPRSEVESIYSATKSGRKVLDTLFLDPIHVEWTTHLLSSLPDLHRGKYDVIWHETGRWGGRILAELRRQQGVRLLDVAHSSHPGWEVPFARCKPDVYVTADRNLAELVQTKVPDLRIEIVRQGIDTELFNPHVAPLALDLPRPIALIAGALSEEKSPALALKACAEAGASVVVAGSGPLSAEIDSLAAENLGRTRYIRTQLDRAEMPALYAAADVVVLASPLESGALALLEAMACGIPVVTTADSIRDELVGAAGILVEGRASDDFAQGITRALDGSWGDRPRLQALEYSIDRAADRYGQILSELAGAPG
jgi:glycosyltransferase involved in cell wall biosynthesis